MTTQESRFNPVVMALCIGAILISIAPVMSIAATPETEIQAVPFDRDGDGRAGEATAIMNRIELYRQSRAIDGKYTAGDALRRARWGYQRWLAEANERYEKGITEAGWISIGPNNGAGRSVVMVPHPTDTGTLLTGAAGGGLWRTFDNGQNWLPLTEGIADLSVGAAAYAPENPDVIYLGTGEGGNGADFIPGIGLLRSDDGGQTWFMPQNEQEILASQFFAISVKHPAGSNVNDPSTYEVLAATNQGLFRSVNGGDTWDRVIGNSSLIGVTHVIRPDVDQDPNLVYAALWCNGSCAPGLARVMKSTDSGMSWTAAADGLPAPASSYDRARIALTSTADGMTLYAGLNTDDDMGGSPVAKIYRSNNGGESWEATGNTGTYLESQGWFDNTIIVHPTDPDKVVAGGVWYVISNNGGSSWTKKNPYILGTSTLPHVDAHDLKWQGERLWVACDGGVWFSDDYGYNWTGRNDGLITRQYYGMALDPIERERVIGGTQDNGTDLRNTIGDNSWQDVIGGDGFDCAINSIIPDIMYGTIYRTQVYRSTNGGSAWSEVSPFIGDDEAPFRTPLTMPWSRPWEIYTGTDRIWKSDDGGDSWANLSTSVENGQWTGRTVRAIAVSETDPNMVMISKGPDVYTTRNGGKSWWRSTTGRNVNGIAISPFDPDIAIACAIPASNGLAGVMLTNDGGASWGFGGWGLPPFAIHAAVWDPTDPNIIFAGTDVGLYRSVDGGINWNRFGDGLPAASVHDLRVLPDASMLRVATHGRGMWELQIENEANTNPHIDITSHAASVNGTTGDTVHLAATASDADGDELSIDWYVTDVWNKIEGATGSGTVSSETDLTFTSGGRYDIIARATDSKGGGGFDRITALVFESANECSTPRVIPGAGPFPTTVITSNTTATYAASDPDVYCINDPDVPNAGAEASLWFEFTPVESNTYQISTCTSQSDTVLSVWTGPECGEYNPVPGGCNDDDELVHCFGQRTDSYLELALEAGTTYRILLGAYENTSQSKGRVRLHIDCPTCETVIPGQRYIVPAAAHAEGDNNTTWLTDLDIYNPSATDVTAEIAFLPEGSDNSAASSEEVTIGAGTARSFGDIVFSMFNASGSGALSIVTSEEVLIASRTYNNAAEGTFGQFIPGVFHEQSVPAGGEIRLTGLAGNDDFRTNIGVMNTSDTSAAVSIDLYDSQSTLLATRPESVLPYGWLQVNSIFDKENTGDIEAATIVVRNLSDSAAILAYASIVDEYTGDPTYVTEAALATIDEPVVIAAAAHADGTGNSVWRTDLELANVSDAPVTATIELLVEEQANLSPISTVHTIAANASLRVGDVLASDFGLTGTAALRITVDQGQLIATSRTYNQAEIGTYGQFIPAVRESFGIETGQKAALIQLRQKTDAFRTNVGIVNMSEVELVVDANFFDNEGGYIGYTQYTLDPWEYDQFNGAIPGNTQTQGAFVILSSATPDANYLAYASVIDSGSDDPVFIPASIME